VFALLLSASVAVSGCNRIAATITCDNLRLLHVGMTDTQVARVLGPPIQAAYLGPNVHTTLGFDFESAYHRDSLAIGPMTVPSEYRAFLRFKDHHLLLATVSKRFPVFGTDHTLFALDKDGVSESPDFKTTFCGDR